MVVVNGVRKKKRKNKIKEEKEGCVKGEVGREGGKGQGHAEA